MNHAYHCFHYWSYHHNDSLIHRLHSAALFFMDKASYYWSISQ